MKTFLLGMIGVTWLTGAGFQIQVDTSKAPDVAAYGERSKAVCEEWYPKINEVLYGADHRLPFAVVRMVFEPMDGVAYTLENVIHVSAGYIKQMPDDFRAMVIHELAHVNQSYKNVPRDAGWLTEGIADYIRHKYYEKDIEAKLRMDQDGYLKGYKPDAPLFYGMQQNREKLAVKGYLKAYTVAATFLFWLERWKDKKIVAELNVALSEDRYSAGLFGKYCRASLDKLWEEFIIQSRTQN
jgi:hypothetical protein